MQIDFDVLAERISEMEGNPISATINNVGREYYFHSLKPSFSLNPDVCGVSLNNAYQQPNGYKKSRFHDKEDVDISFKREEFISAEARTINGDFSINIKMCNFGCLLEIDGQPNGRIR